VRRARGPRRERDGAAGAGPRLREGEGRAGGGGGRLRAEAELSAPPLPAQFGGQAHGDVDHTRVQCRALDGIECAEPRSFLRGSRPCVR